MFNYYYRIASLARELESDGRFDKADWVRLILESENRCIFCGCDLRKREDSKHCLACAGKYRKASLK